MDTNSIFTFDFSNKEYYQQRAGRRWLDFCFGVVVGLFIAFLMAYPDFFSVKSNDILNMVIPVATWITLTFGFLFSKRKLISVGLIVSLLLDVVIFLSIFAYGFSHLLQ